MDAHFMVLLQASVINVVLAILFRMGFVTKSLMAAIITQTLDYVKIASKATFYRTVTAIPGFSFV